MVENFECVFIGGLPVQTNCCLCQLFLVYIKFQSELQCFGSKRVVVNDVQSLRGYPAACKVQVQHRTPGKRRKCEQFEFF